MTTEQFAYWLKGFFEIENPKGSLDERKVQIIKDHLNLVFHKVTPNRDEKSSDKSSLIEELKKSAQKFNEEYNKGKENKFFSDLDIPLCVDSNGTSDFGRNYRVYC